MPRAARVRSADGVYHVTSRGNGNEMILASDEDKRILLSLVAKVAAERSWKILAYCVMGNHFHLVLRTPADNLSDGMHTIDGSYGEIYNKHHGHRGHVFQGRFFSALIATDSYLLEACRYTVLNPVRAGLVADPGEWPWSSYAASASGYRQAVPVADEMLLAMLDTRDIEDARQTYREFVQAGIGVRKPDFLMPRRRGRAVVVAETPQEPPHNLKPDELTEEILQLRKEGYTLRSIAQKLGVSRMRVCRCAQENQEKNSDGERGPSSLQVWDNK